VTVMLSTTVLAIIRDEMHRHRFDTFVDDPPSIAQGGRGVVVSGCSLCRVQFGTVEQYVQHLTERVMRAVCQFECEQTADAVRCSEVARNS
jgi:hypothetical protein